MRKTWSRGSASFYLPSRYEGWAAARCRPETFTEMGQAAGSLTKKSQGTVAQANGQVTLTTADSQEW